MLHSISRMAKMERIYWNYIVDMGLVVTFLLSGITGIIKFPGLLWYFGISFFQLPMRTINWLHNWMGIAMVVLVFIHLVLHWKWIVMVTKKIIKNARKKETSKEIIEVKP